LGRPMGRPMGETYGGDRPQRGFIEGMIERRLRGY